MNTCLSESFGRLRRLNVQFSRLTSRLFEARTKQKQWALMAGSAAASQDLTIWCMPSTPLTQRASQSQRNNRPGTRRLDVKSFNPRLEKKKKKKKKAESVSCMKHFLTDSLKEEHFMLLLIQSDISRHHSD